MKDRHTQTQKIGNTTYIVQRKFTDKRTLENILKHLILSEN